MKPEAYLIHSAPGRCRIRIPAKRYDEDYFQHIDATLSDIPGIVQMRTNPLAASILILHDQEELSSDDLLAQLQGFEHFSLTEQVYSHTVWEQAVNGLDTFDHQLKTITAGRFDYKSLLFVVLVIMAVRQLQQGAVLGPAAALFWYALQVLTKDKHSS